MRTTSRGRERLIRALAVLAVLAGLAYLIWRVADTLNPQAPVLSWALWGAEAWTILTAALFFFSVWDPFRRGEPPPPPRNCTVDVFVPTVNEPEWVVRRTLVGAIAIDYPHRTWLLDDGNRPEMRALAEELGAGYLPRDSAEGAKAGHLNYALARTDGEFVTIFDADHIATPKFLDRTLGWFEDDDVAVVQTPQEFYNVDSFEHEADTRRNAAWHEQTIFHRLIQPGKDRWNAAFFCGSNAVLRRTALEDAGGFPTETVTEDIHLSILLHARGWRSVFHREVLAYGLAPQTAVAYQTQRLRWGQGGMQVLRKANPLLVPGLSMPQRLSYLTSLLPWFDGWQKVILYTIPPLFLVTGRLPLRAEALPFAAAFMGTYGLLLLAAKLASRGTSNFLLTEGYRAATFPIYLKATMGLFARGSLQFAVTDKKGHGRVPFRAVRWQATFVVFMVAAIGVGAYRLSSGAEPNDLAFWVALGWTSFNLGMLSWATFHILTTVERRGEHRIPAFVPSVWHDGDTAGVGVLENLNSTGGRLRVLHEIGEPVLEIELWPATYHSAVGKVESRRPGPAGTTILGLRWIRTPEGPDPQDVTALAVLFAQRRFLRFVDNPRRHRSDEWVLGRLSDSVPVRLLDTGPYTWGMLYQNRRRGIVLSPVPAVAGNRLRIAPWDGMSVWSATIEHVKRMHLGPYAVFDLRVRDIEDDGHRIPGTDPLPVAAILTR